MAITQEVHFEMLEKLPDGNFKAKYPKVKSKSGVTFDEHLADSVYANQLHGIRVQKGVLQIYNTEAKLWKDYNRIYTDNTNSPGPKDLIAGDSDYGYFGVVPHTELIGGVPLALQIGLSAGTPINLTDGWFKFIDNGEILFIAKKPFRKNISWDNINTANAVFGTKSIAIGGLTYKIRLMTGGNANPATSAGGEWNKFMYAMYKSQLPNWENFEDGDIGVGASTDDAQCSWCQEVGSNSTFRVNRGGPSDITIFGNGRGMDKSNYVSNLMSWRPVLQLVK